MPNPLNILAVFTFLLIKHFLFDFILQPPWQWKNKGTYGHPGGIIHALQHGISTYIILVMFNVNYSLAFDLVIFEIVAHYHIDWLKMNINKKMRWKPDTHEQFWWLLGADQLAHQLCYTMIIYWGFF